MEPCHTTWHDAFLSWTNKSFYFSLNCAYKSSSGCWLKIVIFRGCSHDLKMSVLLYFVLHYDYDNDEGTHCLLLKLDDA